MSANDRVPSVIESYFDQIYALETEPDIFRVVVDRCAAVEGYRAYATFYSGHGDGEESTSTKGTTPEGALLELLDALRNRYTPCPLCGRYEKSTIE